MRRQVAVVAMAGHSASWHRNLAEETVDCGRDCLTVGGEPIL